MRRGSAPLPLYSSVFFYPDWFSSSSGGPRWSTTHWTQISSGSSSWTTSLRRSRTCALTCELFPQIRSSGDTCHFSPTSPSSLCSYQNMIFSVFPCLPFPSLIWSHPSPLLPFLLSASQLLPEELFIGACFNSHPFKADWYKDHKYFIWSFIPNLPSAKQSKYLSLILLKNPPLLCPTALLVLGKGRLLRGSGMCVSFRDLSVGMVFPPLSPPNKKQKPASSVFKRTIPGWRYRSLRTCETFNEFMWHAIMLQLCKRKRGRELPIVITAAHLHLSLSQKREAAHTEV